MWECVPKGTLRAVFAFASAVSLIKQSICIPAPQMKFLVVSLGGEIAREL
jgi:hypothetical protein